MISTSAAMPGGPPGLPRSPVQKVAQRSQVNHFCAWLRLSSLRRVWRACFHFASCSLMRARASSESLVRMPCFHGVFGRLPEGLSHTRLSRLAADARLAVDARLAALYVLRRSLSAGLPCRRREVYCWMGWVALPTNIMRLSV